MRLNTDIFTLVRAAFLLLAMAAALLATSAQALENASIHSDYRSKSGTACNFPMICTGHKVTSSVHPIQMARQDDSVIYAATDTEATAAPEATPKMGYPKMLWEDTKHVLGAPARWDEQEWHDMGWAALGIVGVMAVIDRPVQDAMRRIAPDNDPLTPDDNRFLHEMERFGREYSLGLLGGFYVAGALTDNQNSIAVAQDGLTSIIIASGIITTVSKVAVGRARPRDDVGTTHFRPFSGNQSFPSGHTSHAFSVASVIANHYDETWVTCASYTVASLVGVARSYHGGHFTSDILAGAMIGTLVGKSVVEYNKSLRSNKMVILPEAAPGMVGLRMVSRF